ncbi:MAG: cobalamin biosynthesis protein CbiA [Planctomycetes bacterium]|nr:cobalamin biosynthesis protein CbiA [Planctomycetota bacterium]
MSQAETSDAGNQVTKLSFEKKILIITGNYGSGKTEISVNLALGLRASGHPVTIIDLDLVNPYFRAREAIDVLEKNEVNVIVPTGEHYYADLPILVPQVRARIIKPDGYIVLDVGGDDVGARVLASFSDVLTTEIYEMLFVANISRPFTENVEGINRILREIEASSSCKVTGLIGNTHLMEFTDANTVYNGYETTNEFSEKYKIPMKFVAVMREIADKIDKNRIKCPILPLERLLVPPFKRRIRKSPLYYV